MKKLISCLSTTLTSRRLVELQLFVLLFITNQDIISQNREFQLELSTEKSVYVEQEEIILKIKLINKSKRTDSVWICGGSFNILTGLNVYDDKGKKYKYVGVQIDCFDYYEKLYPGEFLEWDESILYSYGDLNSDFNKNHWYFREGIYSISFNGRPGQYNPTMKSNEVIIKIIKPAQTDGYDKLKEIFSINNYSNKLDSLSKFIYDYPQSAYIDNAFGEYVISQIYYPVYNLNLIRDIKYFISKRYNSWGVYDYLRYGIYAVNKIKKEDTAENLLAYIINKYPNSKASSAAYEILKKEIPNDFYIKMLLSN